MGAGMMSSRLLGGAGLAPKPAGSGAAVGEADAVANAAAQAEKALAAAAKKAKDCPPKIHPGKQANHTPGHKSFQPGKSELTHPDPQSLVDRFAGKGQRNGQREWVDTGENVGNYVKKGETGVPTTRITIHYAEDNTVHIVPAPPRPPTP